MLTVTAAKLYLRLTGTEDDALLTELCAAAGSFAEAFCGRPFATGTFTETHQGGGRYLVLDHYPAASVTVAGLDPAAYRVAADRGVVEAVTPPFPRGDLAVTVTVPGGSTPPAVVRAAAELVGHWLRQEKTHALTGQLNVSTATGLDGVSSILPWGQATGYRVPAGVIESLRPFQVPAVG